MHYMLGRSQVCFPMESLGFLLDLILPAALWLRGRLSSNKNEYQGYILEVKAAGAYG